MPASASVGLPELDEVALGIVELGEPADAGRVPFGVRDDLDPARGEGGLHPIEAVYPEVQLPLLRGRDLIGVHVVWREDRRARLLVPHPVVAAADAEMLGIPGGQRIWVPCAEEETTDAGHAHVCPLVSWLPTPVRLG